MPEVTVANISEFTGRELGVSDWLTVDQAMINQFAECSGDTQWIHVDVARAIRESPFGGPVAHGFLTLSLLPQLLAEGSVVTCTGRTLAMPSASILLHGDTPGAVALAQAIRAAVTDLGMTIRPSCRCQRMTTWAGVLC